MKKSSKSTTIKVPYFNLPFDSTWKGDYLQIFKQQIVFGRELSFDLNFFDYDQDASIVKKKETLKEAESKSAIRLIEFISSKAPSIPKEITDEEICKIIDEAIRNVFGIEKTAENWNLVASAFQSSRYLTLFMDKLLELWINTPIGKIVMLLKLMHHPSFIGNVKRNHLVVLCHYLLYRKDLVISSCLYDLMVEIPQLSWGVLESLVIDEVMKQSNDSVAFACRAIKFLEYFHQKGLNTSENLFDIFERVMQNIQNPKLNTTIIDTVYRIGNVSKKLFEMIERIYLIGLHSETLSCRFYQFCKATNSLHLVQDKRIFKRSTNEEEQNELKKLEQEESEMIVKSVKTGFTMMKFPKFDTEAEDYDERLSSMEQLKKHLKDCDFSKDPTLDQKILERNKDFADFKYVSTLFARFLYYTSKLTDFSNGMIKDVRLSADDVLGALVNSRKPVDFLQSDYQHLIDYLFEENYNLRLTDILYFFGMCCRHEFMIIEYLGNRKYSIKPFYTYLIDNGVVERIEKLMRENIKLASRENEISKRLKVDYINESLGLLSGIFTGMKTHGDLGRLKYLLNETKIFETLVHCWAEFEWSTDVIFECLIQAMDISEKLALSLIFDKYILAVLTSSLDYASSKNKTEFAAMTIALAGKLSGQTAIAKQNGKLPKLPRVILSALLGSGFLKKSLVYLSNNVKDFKSKKKVDCEDEHIWPLGISSLFAYAVRHAPIRELFYEDDFKYLRIVLVDVLYPLHIHLSKVTFERIETSTLAFIFGNFYSVVNHVLWDKKGRDFLFDSVSNRTLAENLTLEFMNFKWITRALKYLQEKKTSKKLDDPQQMILGRSIYCMSWMLESKTFEKQIAQIGINFIVAIMKLLDFTSDEFVVDINKAIIKVLFTLTQSETFKKEIDLSKILKFMVAKLDGPFSEMVTGLFYSLIASPNKEETEALVKSKFTQLKPFLERATSSVPKCQCCGKLYTVNTILKKCGGCGLVYYCGLECQKKDRNNHKDECIKKN